ncbi:MAG: hypothetical protein OES27_06915 [Nitrosopumilus sp.]|nr:hypothetical protein [Nitrosopumilus sp.]
MNLGFIQTWTNSGKLSKINMNLFHFIIVCAISISLIQTSYAQTTIDSGEQITFTDNLLNDPAAQDILKKIEQTRKLIEQLEQKEYEKNQAQENLQKKRDMSVERLNQDLNEWERLWEKHSSRNTFNEFVNKKPSYVQGVFWDQFEFKEKKVNAGRIAMNQVLINGGTIQDAKDAYNKAAATKKIELIEMNSQFNIKHNLADHREQQIFNSTGQIHMSPVTQTKLATFYSDYKIQPSYMIANSDAVISEIDSGTKCNEGLVLVSRVTSGTHSCVDESIAKKWISEGINGIVISDGVPPLSKVQVNPGTECKEGHQVVYDIATSEYQCVLEAVAKEMISNDIAENHTLIDYILNKDKLKVYEDTTYQVNQEILRINEEHDIKKKTQESKYNESLKNEDLVAKQKMREIIKEYKIGNITREDVTKQISETRKTKDANKERILQEKTDAVDRLELELKDRILEAVKGYENNSDINVDWDYLNKTSDIMLTVNDDDITKISKTSFSGKDEVYLENIDVINSFGQRFDEIKSNQILQVAADITNPHDFKNNFVYMVEITNERDIPVQPAKWMTGTLNPNQTLNVSLSWIPEETGTFNAAVFIGTEIDSILHVDDIKINVNPEVDVSDKDYCKKGHELLFKYSDNSPICATPNTASKLISIGLVFD